MSVRISRLHWEGPMDKVMPAVTIKASKAPSDCQLYGAIKRTARRMALRWRLENTETMEVTCLPKRLESKSLHLRRGRIPR